LLYSAQVDVDLTQARLNVNISRFLEVALRPFERDKGEKNGLSSWLVVKKV
jgi:hypothetical protein